MTQMKWLKSQHENSWFSISVPSSQNSRQPEFFTRRPAIPNRKTPPIAVIQSTSGAIGMALKFTNALLWFTSREEQSVVPPFNLEPFRSSRVHSMKSSLGHKLLQIGEIKS